MLFLVPPIVTIQLLLDSLLNLRLTGLCQGRAQEDNYPH
jgi:hypothetical protein